MFRTDAWPFPGCVTGQTKYAHVFHSLLCYVSLYSYQYTSVITKCFFFYYIKMKSHLTVCLSVCMIPRHADNSLVRVSIETKLARNDSCAFWHHTANLFFELFSSYGISTAKRWRHPCKEKTANIKKANGSSSGEVAFSWLQWLFD